MAESHLSANQHYIKHVIVLTITDYEYIIQMNHNLLTTTYELTSYM